MWIQKAKGVWIMLGDKNTAYFHSKVWARLGQLNIRMLNLRNNEWCFDEDRLRL